MAAYPEYEGSLPVYFLFRYVENQYTIYNYDKTIYEAIDAFVLHEQLPLVTDLSVSTMHRMLSSSHDKYVLIFRGDRTQLNGDEVEILKSVAKQYRGQGSSAPYFAVVNYVEGVVRGLFGLLGDDRDTIIMFASARRSGSTTNGDGTSLFDKYIVSADDLEGEFDAKVLQMFISNATTGKLPPFLMSRPSVTKQTYTHVHYTAAHELNTFLNKMLSDPPVKVYCVLFLSFGDQQYEYYMDVS